MKAIVTVVINNGLPKWQPKRVGIDMLGRLSTDADSRHKSILIRDIETTEKASEKAIDLLKEKGLSGRISRVEMI